MRYFTQTACSSASTAAKMCTQIFHPFTERCCRFFDVKSHYTKNILARISGADLYGALQFNHGEAEGTYGTSARTHIRKIRTASRHDSRESIPHLRIRTPPARPRDFQTNRKGTFRGKNIQTKLSRLYTDQKELRDIRTYGMAFDVP